MAKTTEIYFSHKYGGNQRDRKLKMKVPSGMVPPEVCLLDSQVDVLFLPVLTAFLLCPWAPGVSPYV